MRNGVAVVWVLVFGVPSNLTAQELSSTRLHPPDASPYVSIAGSMEVPDGSYRVRMRDHVGAVTPLDRDVTYQISCLPAPRQLGSAARRACRVLELSVTPACSACTPYAITFEDVSFARHTSTLPDDDGYPVTDVWHGDLRIGARLVRLFISFDRFVVQDMDEREPSIAIVEGPIERPGETRRRLPDPD
jgi:hypothetical protein